MNLLDKNGNLLEPHKLAIFVINNGTRIVGKIKKDTSDSFGGLIFQSSEHGWHIHEYWSHRLEIIQGYSFGIKDALKVIWLRIKYYLFLDHWVFKRILKNNGSYHYLGRKKD